MMRALGRPSKWFFLLEAALPRLETRKAARSEIERRIRQVAGILQIEDLLERKPSQLSGGQRQRLARHEFHPRHPGN